MWITTLFYVSTIGIAAWAETDMPESRLVHIAQGPVRGYKDLRSGVYFFQGIPYASIPTGKDRFKPPLPPPTWIQPLEAVNRTIICPQAALILDGLPELSGKQADCLIASVYIPYTEEKNLSVVVYVHGGGYQVGSGDMFSPSKLVAENSIIAVTFNYRLGAHGFLCLGTEDVPGNAGMKDQVAALRWVKNNIASFGGDPNDVTLAGYSSGSGAVDLLMLSKSAEGLFNKVIPESGGSVAIWNIQSDPLENAQNFAKQLNFTDVNDIYSLEYFYKTVSFELLTSDAFFDRTDSTFVFSPCVERAIEGQAVFLDRSPLEILKSGDYKKVPLLYGFADMEGLLRISLFDYWKNHMNEKFSDFLPADLQFESKEQKEEVASQIKQFYFGDELVTNDNILSYVDYFGDVLFTYAMLRTVKLHVEAGHDQIYLYEYSFVDDNVPLVPHTNVRGANHCDQTMVIYGSTLRFINPDKTTNDFLKMSSIMNKIWGCFIKTGKPPPAGSSEVPAWPAVARGLAPHMSLGSELVLRGALLERRASFWDRIYAQHYRHPIPPPVPIPSTPKKKHR